MNAIIMAGGEGTRLRPLTCGIPKPLAKLCGRPVVYYILDLLEVHGFKKAVFTLGYRGEQIERLFENGKYKDINLDFSAENIPLGTAGCVKKAAGDFTSEFLVISGDALCDFDLTAALNYHKERRAVATIITKKVDDPREYGLVISDNGRITGFSEKPSYLNCISDCANTGVYILSPRVLEFIPSGQSVDFARDVFPRMLKSETPLYAYEENGYWCDIGNFSTYASSQRDIMLGKVKRGGFYEKIAENVYNVGKSPHNVNVKGVSYIGNNCDFGENVTLDSCVLGDNVSIGGNSRLRNAVVLDGAFVSDNVTVNNAVICSGAKLMSGAEVFEDAVVGENAVIGKNAVVSGSVKIWNDKEIPAGVTVKQDVKYGTRLRTELSERGFTGETNADITPDFCSRLGAALTCLGGKIAAASEDNNASKAMLKALSAGIAGSGGITCDCGTVTLPQLIYASNLLDCGVIIRIKCGVFADLEILGRYGLPLTRQEERKLEGALTRAEYRNAVWNDFGEIKNISGIAEIYESMLERHARFNSGYKLSLNCNNTALTRLLTPLFAKISAKSGETLVVTLTNGGTKAEFYTENDEKIGYDRLIMLAAVNTMKNGSDVALPHDFAASADFLAQSYGKRIYRYFLCSNDDSDRQARALAAKQMFLRDGALLALNILELLASSGISLDDALKSIPDYVLEKRVVEINCPPQRVLSRVCEKGCGIGEGVVIGKENGRVLLRSSKKGNSLFVFAESFSAETAKELCDSAEALIKKLSGNSRE